MPNIKTLIRLGILLFISGCVPSLHALYTDQDTTFDRALLGVWTTGNGQESMAFSKSDDDKAYKLIYTDKDGKTGDFVAHLVKLKDAKFLDLFPEGSDIPQNDFYHGHLVPAHSFFRVDQIDPTLRLADMDYDWMKQFLAANPNALAHETMDKDRIVLTASTQDLQKFVLDHLKDEGTFGKPTELKRQEAATRP